MKKNLTLLLCAGLFAGIAFLTFNGIAQDKSKDEKASEGAQYLFVQNASGLSSEGGKITLKGVNSETIFFSDRPERIAGHTPTAYFVKEWGVGEDNFAENNPNATLAVFGEKTEPVDAVVVLSNPVLKGNDLTYDVKVIEGKIPATGEGCSLFIDIIGRPMTPVSVAGVARRTTRRHMVYGAAAAGAYPYAGSPYANTQPSTVIINNY